MSNYTNISFNGNSLQQTTGSFQIITGDIDHFSDPTKTMKMSPLAHSNQSVIPFVEYPSKIIKVSGVLTDTTIAALDADIDTFKSWFNGLQNVGKNLDIDYDGGTRQYTATANNIKVTRPVGLLYAKFSIDFDCTNPFGQATTSTSLLNLTGQTVNLLSEAITVPGTAPISLPVITVTLTAVSDSSGGFITISNANTGQGITVNRTWAVNDQLIIDCTQIGVLGGNPVTVNGVPVAFSGAFPEFAPGSQTLAYQDNLTSRTFNLTVSCMALYE